MKNTCFMFFGSEYVSCYRGLVDHTYLLWGPEVLLPYFCRLDGSEKWPEGDRQKGKTLWGGRNSSRSETGRAGGWPIIAVLTFDKKRRADGAGRTEDAEQHHDPRLRLSAGEKVSASRRGKYRDASTFSLAAALTVTFDLVASDTCHMYCCFTVTPTCNVCVS